MIYAGIWGIFTGRFIFEKKSHMKKFHFSYIVIPLISSAFIHGLYDYFLLDDTLVLGALMAVVADYMAVLFSYKIYIKAGEYSPYKLYPLKEFNKAITLINMALKHDPGNHMLNKRIGLYYLYAGDYKSAAEHFDACIKINPENFYCHAFSGVSMILSGRREPGMLLFQESLKKITGSGMDALKKNIKSVIEDGQVKDEILAMLEK